MNYYYYSNFQECAAVFTCSWCCQKVLVWGIPGTKTIPKTVILFLFRGTAFRYNHKQLNCRVEVWIYHMNVKWALLLVFSPYWSAGSCGLGFNLSAHRGKHQYLKKTLALHTNVFHCAAYSAKPRWPHAIYPHQISWGWLTPIWKWIRDGGGGFGSERGGRNPSQEVRLWYGKSVRRAPAPPLSPDGVYAIGDPDKGNRYLFVTSWLRRIASSASFRLFHQLRRDAGSPPDCLICIGRTFIIYFLHPAIKAHCLPRRAAK